MTADQLAGLFIDRVGMIPGRGPLAHARLADLIGQVRNVRLMRHLCVRNDAFRPFPPNDSFTERSRTTDAPLFGCPRRGAESQRKAAQKA